MKWSMGEEDDGHVEFEIPVYHSGLKLSKLFGCRCRFGNFLAYVLMEATGSENGGMEETI